MNATTEMKVLVYKSNLPMMPGESIGNYTNNLWKAVKPYLAQKMNTTVEKTDAWMVETYSDKLVAAIYSEKGSTKYYAFTYSRDKNGSFTFGSLVEMERVTVYKPKAQMIAKAANPESFLFPGWKETEVKKNIWAGIL